MLLVHWFVGWWCVPFRSPSVDEYVFCTKHTMQSQTFTDYTGDMSIQHHSHYTGGGDVRWTCSIRSAILVWGLATPFGHQGKRRNFGAPGSLTAHFTVKIIQYFFSEGSPISSTVHRDVVNIPTDHRLSTSCQSTEYTLFLLGAYTNNIMYDNASFFLREHVLSQN